MTRSRVILIALIGLCVFLAFRAVNISIRSYGARQELDAVNGQLAQGQAANDRLAAELERMRQPAWLALLARSRLGYAQPGETVVFVYKSQNPGTISQPQSAPDGRSNLRKWWDWLIGN
ncbi:MAG TPA: septum formation initiator family protein [Candidatus Paceibacterota bacterium]|nr:septum formation initiator family protein [Candidatus Paceibacterota bacterium]